MWNPYFTCEAGLLKLLQRVWSSGKRLTGVSWPGAQKLVRILSFLPTQHLLSQLAFSAFSALEQKVLSPGILLDSKLSLLSSVGNIVLSDIFLYDSYSFVRKHYLRSVHCKVRDVFFLTETHTTHILHTSSSQPQPN